MSAPILRLRELPIGYRFGLTFLILTLYGGLAAAGGHLFLHHENRDERPGLSMQDLTGAYHGVRATAAMITALEGGHPEDLESTERELLLGWLGSERISEDYDNLDLGDMSPAEVLDRACLRCHARDASEGDGIGQTVPLEYWDDVEKVSFSRDVSPVDEEILIASAHTHSLSMALISLAIGALALATRWHRGVVGLVFGLSGLALFLDLGSWFLARETAAFVPLIAGSGVTWMATSGVLLLLTLLELWLPRSPDPDPDPDPDPEGLNAEKQR